MMALLLELNKLIERHTGIPKPEIHCKLFKDNNSCISVAESPKITPRTKHMSIKYHHIRSFVKNKSINTSHIGTGANSKIAKIFTKPLEEAFFIYLRKKLSGWWSSKDQSLRGSVQLILWLYLRLSRSPSREWINHDLENLNYYFVMYLPIQNNSIASYLPI